MSDLTVANTILEQLGGRTLMLMTGAKQFVGGPNSLTFRLPGGGGFAKNGINCVRVELEPSNTYTVTFIKIRGVDSKVISMHRDVYCDTLQSVFFDATGLKTRLPRVVGVNA